MKKFLVTILSILYMASAMGATVHIHYCMGKIMSASFRHTDEGICGKCGMKKSEQKKGCCKDEQKTFKTGDHQLAKASFDFSHAQIVVPSLSHYTCYVYPCYAGSVKNIAHANSPPFFWRTCPIYIQVRDFRI